MPTINYSYPAAFNPATYRPVFDPLGTLPANKVTGEKHTITTANGRDFHFIVPLFAPFFGYPGSVSVVHQPTSGPSNTLIEGVDYNLAFQFIGASRGCVKPVFGGITFLNQKLAGVLTLVYHTLGGNWTINQPEINRILADAIVNPRVTAWEQVVDRPALFPVIDHEWNLTDMVGASEIVVAIEDIATAISNRSPTAAMTELNLHLNDFANPHRTTKAHVGLASVQDYSVATTEEAAAGTVANRYMTPVLTKAAIIASESRGNLELTAHTNKSNNPHAVTKDQVGLGSVQNFPVATAQEAVTGTATNRYMTPALVSSLVMAGVSSSGNAVVLHVENINNPHQVTKDQVGLGNVMNYPVATASEAEGGTSIDRYMTPALTNAVVHASELRSNGYLADHLRNINNPHAITKDQVGLGNADNTSDANKPVSTALSNELLLKAPLLSPSLTGTPTAPTADASATPGTQIATLSYVKSKVDALTAAGGVLSNVKNYTAVEQGGGTGQLSNKIHIGWGNDNRLLLHVDATNFSYSWPINVTGNAASVSNGVYTAGAQTIAGIKTFSNQTFFSSGTAALPGIAFSSDVVKDTGFYHIGDGIIGIALNGAYGGKLEAGGNLTMVGDITAYSDERLKTNWRSLPENFVSQLAEVKTGVFDRLDGDKQTQVGVSAQSLQKVLPQAVKVDEDERGTLSVAYGNAALTSAVMLAREVQDLKRQLAEQGALIIRLSEALGVR